MATNFPNSLDALTNPTGTDTLASPDHAGQHADANDAIEALQTKVGVDNSAVTTSLDYKVAQKIDKTLVDAKGDLIVASAADTVDRLAVGTTNGHVLTVDSAEALGVKWASSATTPLGTATPIALGIGSAGTATNAAREDHVHPNTLTLPTINNIVNGFTSVATATGTTTLTSASDGLYEFTGSTTQTVVLPSTATINVGVEYRIINNSTGSLTVRTATPTTLTTQIAGTTVTYICVSTANDTVTSWDSEYAGFSTVTGSGSVVLSSTPTFVTPVLGAATGTSLQTSGAISTTAGNISAIGTVTARNTSTRDGVTLTGRAGGTSTFAVSLTPTTLTSNQTLTLPDATGTVVTTASSSLTSANLLSMLTNETGTGVAVFGTAPTITLPAINNINYGFTTVATAAGTTTLTVNSNHKNFFTGTTTQTVVLPVVSTLVAGYSYEIHNDSTGTVTVNSSGGNLVSTLGAGASCIVTCVLITGTTAASWSMRYLGTVLI